MPARDFISRIPRKREDLLSGKALISRKNAFFKFQATETYSCEKLLLRLSLGLNLPLSLNVNQRSKNYSTMVGASWDVFAIAVSCIKIRGSYGPLCPPSAMPMVVN